jgi:hypothetical protein
VFEVRTADENGMQDAGTQQTKYAIESRRAFRKDAEQDADLLKLFGKKAWIVEV